MLDMLDPRYSLAQTSYSLNCFQRTENKAKHANMQSSIPSIPSDPPSLPAQNFLSSFFKNLPTPFSTFSALFPIFELRWLPAGL